MKSRDGFETVNAMLREDVHRRQVLKALGWSAVGLAGGLPLGMPGVASAQTTATAKAAHEVIHCARHMASCSFVRGYGRTAGVYVICRVRALKRAVPIFRGGSLGA